MDFEDLVYEPGDPKAGGYTERLIARVDDSEPCVFCGSRSGHFDGCQVADR